MVFLNFSGIFEEQPDLLKKGGAETENRVLDLTEMTGVNGYCSDEAKEELLAVIKGTAVSGVHFLDNGNYHYMSNLFIRRIKEPFELVVFDHHTDMQPPGLMPFLSCGSWVLDSVSGGRDGAAFLRKAVLIGPPEESEPEGVMLIGEDRAFRSCNIRPAVRELFGEPGLPVYISIDKDVLSEKEVKLNWDQGRMTLDVLKEWICETAAARRIIGMDICGEPLYNESPDANVRASENINIQLLELYRGLGYAA